MAKAVVNGPEPCDIKNCVVCARSKPKYDLVEEKHIGRVVSYYEEGWRVGTLESVRMYGTYQRDDDGHIISIGRCTVRPLGTIYAKRRPDAVSIPVEDVKLEAAVVLGHRFAQPEQTRTVTVDVAAVPDTPPALPVFAGLDLAAKDDIATPLAVPEKVAAPKPAAVPQAGDIDVTKCIELYKAGTKLLDIAAAVSTPDENGKTRVRRALKKAGVWTGAH